MIVQHFNLNGESFDFQIGQVEIQVVSQPIISGFLPSNIFAHGTSGDITIEGSNFDTSLPMYLRLSFGGSLYSSISEATALSSTSATFHIDPSMIPVVGTYNLEISQYPFTTLPDAFSKFGWTQQEILSKWQVAEFIVVSTPEIVEASPLTVPAQSSGNLLTIRGYNFTQYTL